MNLNDWKDQRHTIFTAAQTRLASIKANGKELTGDALLEHEAAMSSLAVLDEKIARISKIGASGAEAHSQTPVMALSNDGRRLPIFAKGQSVEAYTRQQGNHTGPEDGEVSLGAMCRGGGTPAVRAALSEGTDSAGGVTVPVVLSGQLIDAIRARNQVFAAGALTLGLDTGKTTTIARIVGDATATWRAENSAVSTSDMTFAPVTLTPKTLAVTVLASRELIEDSENIGQAIMMSLAAAFALELDRVALLGAGTGSEPQGVAGLSGIGSYSMGTNGAVISNYDPFVQALAILRGANALDPSAVIINPRTDLEINLLKDGQGRPLDRPQAIENLPFLVTSKLPITETQGTSTTACRAVMGKFDELIVGIRNNLRVEVLREKYSDNLQYGFLAYLRADVAVKHTASFCRIIGIN